MINYIDIAIIVFFLAFSYVGYKRGILISVLSLLRYVIGLPLCYGICDRYTQSAYTTFIEPKAVDYINNKINSANSIEEFSNSIKNSISSLPAGLRGHFDISKFDFSTQNLAEAIVKKAFEPALISATKAVIFLIAFVLFFGSTAILIAIINSAKRRRSKEKGKTALSKIDSGLGLLLGVVKYLIIVLVIASALRFAVTLDTSEISSFTTQVSESKILSLINEINPLDKYIGG